MSGRLNRTALALRSAYFGPATRQLSAAWQWWTAELKPLLPGNIRQLIDSANQRLIITSDGDEFVLQHSNQGRLQELGRIPKGNDAKSTFPLPDRLRQTILHLPEGKILSRNITLPLAAEENLREVLSFEMDRQTPYRASEVHYDYAVTERAAQDKTLSLRLFVAPRKLVDQALQVLTTNGIHPDVVVPHASDNPDDLAINLLPADTGNSRGVFLRRLNGSLAALAFLLLATAVSLPLIQKDRVLDSLQAQLASATTAAQAGNKLRQEVEQLVDGSSYLVKKKQAEVTIMQILREMTAVVPDDTWVNRIDISNGEIQLHGQSGSAAGLIATIEASTLFHNTRFRSPVTQVVNTEQERFHLSADSAPEDAQ